LRRGLVRHRFQGKDSRRGDSALTRFALLVCALVQLRAVASGTAEAGIEAFAARRIPLEFLRLGRLGFRLERPAKGNEITRDGIALDAPGITFRKPNGHDGARTKFM